MKKFLKFGLRECMASLIGIGLFVVMTEAQIPFPGLRTAFQPRMVILAMLSATYGPIVGTLVGIFGHALGDALYYGAIWWSWALPEAVVGIGIGSFAHRFQVLDGGFRGKNLLIFNIAQLVANAIAWLDLAPFLDIIFYGEDRAKIFRAQGPLAFMSNASIIAIAGTILLYIFSRWTGGSKLLRPDEWT